MNFDCLVFLVRFINVKYMHIYLEYTYLFSLFHFVFLVVLVVWVENSLLFRPKKQKWLRKKRRRSKFIVEQEGIHTQFVMQKRYKGYGIEWRISGERNHLSWDTTDKTNCWSGL